jgi:hypothetical protein
VGQLSAVWNGNKIFCVGFLDVLIWKECEFWNCLIILMVFVGAL